MHPVPAIVSATLAFGLAAATGCATPQLAPMAGIHVYESRADDATTEGDTTLAVDPDAAFRATCDYSKWASIFPDIREVIPTALKPGDAPGDARVTFVHRDGNRDNLHFRNRDASRVVWFEDTGGSAQVWAEITFDPGPTPHTTIVHSRLFADVHGFASLFVSDNHVRALRQRSVQRDLASLHSYFSRDHVTASYRR